MTGTKVEPPASVGCTFKSTCANGLNDVHPSTHQEPVTVFLKKSGPEPLLELAVASSTTRGGTNA